VRDKVIALAEVRLNAQDPTAARNVLDALRGMRDVNTLDLVGGYVAHPLDETSGMAALRTLGAIGSPRGLTILAPALTSTLAGVRAQSLRAVRELRANVGDKVITNGSAYIALLSDSDETVRREAAYTLAFLGQGGLNPDANSSGVNALINTVQTDSSAKVRKAAAWALGEIGNPAGRDALRKAASDSDAQVRSIAAGASARLK
jgi:HEAT repeat protein